MRAVVLSGGGAFGSYEAGALKYLAQEEKREWDLLCGVSAGALNAAYLSQAKQGELGEYSEKLCQLWVTTSTPMVYKKWPLGYLGALCHPSVFNSRPYVKLVQDNLDLAKVAVSGRKARIGAVCWDTGEYHVATEQSSIFDWWTIASASFPVFFLPVKIDGKHYGDGGLRNVTPIKEALKAGAKKIDVIVAQNVNTISEWVSKGKNAIPDYMIRGLDIITKEVSLTDLQVAGIENPFVELTESYSDVKITVCQPTKPLAGSSLEFNPETAKENIRRGYEDAKRVWG